MVAINSLKETIMMTLAITGTVLGITSTALHFRPQSHGQNNNSTVVVIAPQDIVELNYTVEELKNTQRPPIVDINGDEFPTFVHIKGEPYDALYPLKYYNQSSSAQNNPSEDQLSRTTTNLQNLTTATFKHPSLNRTFTIILNEQP